MHAVMSCLQGCINRQLEIYFLELRKIVMYTENRCAPLDELWRASAVQKQVDDLTSCNTAIHTTKASSVRSFHHGVT